METEIDEDWTSCIYKRVESPIKDNIVRNDEDEFVNLLEKSLIKNSIVRDDEDEFVTLLGKSLVINSGLVKLKLGEYEVCPYKLLEFICHHRAVNCGTAFVKGKTGLKLDLSIPINQGAFPLHEAASSLSPRLVELLLHHGARADVQCNSVVSEHNGLLPLHIALERVRYNKNLVPWTPRNSIFKLIIMLCLPKMKEALETNRLLAHNTKGINEVIRYFAKDGKLIELAVLLMVAREKVMDPITFEGVDLFSSTGCMTLHECIKVELGTLINYEFKLMYKKEDINLARICKKLKEAMISMLMLLEIFERAGDAIEAYLQLERTNVKQVAKEVAGILSEADFKLPSRVSDLSNTIDRSPTKPVLEHSSDPVEEEKEQSEEPVQCGSNQHDVHVVFSRPKKKPTYALPNDNWRLLHTRLSRGSSDLTSIQPLHVFWNGKANFCSGFPKTMGNQVKERLIGEGQYVQKFSPIKQCAYFVSVVKRGIRCI